LKETVIEGVAELHLSEKLEDIKEAVVDKAAELHLRDRAEDLKEAVIEKAFDLADSAMESLNRPVELTASDFNTSDFSEHGDLHLNLFAFTAKDVNFIWPRLVPSIIFEMEELARSERIAQGVDPILFGKWHRIGQELQYTRWNLIVEPALERASELAESAKDIAISTKESVAQFSEDLTEAVGEAFTGRSNLTGGLATGVVQSLPDVSHAVTGLFGSISGLAHKVVESTTHVVDVAKDKLGYHVDLSSMAAEEKERTRRMNDSFVDPMVEARKRRVEEELLQNVKSV